MGEIVSIISWILLNMETQISSGDLQKANWA